MSVEEISEKIEQLVFDENKVVTYKLLSTELSVHVNKAKQLLNEYITDLHTKRNNDLNVYYAVSGFQKYNGHKIHKLTVVSKDELEKVKKDFIALSSIHIYSIQKCSSLDECSVYTSDYLLTKASDDPSEFSAIRHPNRKIREATVVKNAESNADKGKNRTTESQAARKTELQKSSVPAKKTNSLFTSWQKKDDLKNKQKNKNVIEQNDSPPGPKNDSTVVGKMNNGSPQKVSKVADKDNKNNIMNLFSKQAVKSTSKLNTQNSEKSAAQNNVVPSERTVKEKVVERNAEKEKAKKTEMKAASKNKGRVQKKRQKNQRSHDSSENESEDEFQKPKKKKHKRIVSAFSDSESESEAEEKKDRAQRNLMDSRSPAKIENNVIEEVEEDPLPPMQEDEEEPIPPTPTVHNGKRKKLKIVSKMFEDEDGFLVTQKVKEYVTDSEGSDNEAAAHVKASPKAVPKPDIKRNVVNKKQASLMSFFKQK